MKIEILGMGCAKCKQLEENVKRVLQYDGKDVEVIKVTDINAIVAYGVMSTPALVIDGSVKCTGRIPDAKEIAKWVTVPPRASDGLAKGTNFKGGCSCGGKCGD